MKYDSVLANCPICGSAETRFYHSDLRRNRISVCEECKFQFMNPQYSDRYLAEFYARYYSHHSQIEQEPISYAHDFYLKKIEKYLNQKGKLLDYGCGVGRVMNAARQRGWTVVGYDIDCETTKKVEKVYNFEIKCGPFEDVDWGGHRFDVVYLHHVLEHVKNPVRTIRTLRDLLNEKAYLFVGVPNMRSLSSTVKTYLERKGIRRRRIGAHYATDHHLLYFSKQSLRNLLEKCGFAVVYARNGYKAKNDDPYLKKIIMKYVTDHIYPNSQMIMLAQRKD